MAGVILLLQKKYGGGDLVAAKKYGGGDLVAAKKYGGGVLVAMARSSQVGYIQHNQTFFSYSSLFT
jgi:hypothetical protein